MALWSPHTLSLTLKAFLLHTARFKGNHVLKGMLRWTALPRSALFVNLTHYIALWPLKTNYFSSSWHLGCFGSSSSSTHHCFAGRFSFAAICEVRVRDAVTSLFCLRLWQAWPLPLTNGLGLEWQQLMEKQYRPDSNWPNPIHTLICESGWILCLSTEGLSENTASGLRSPFAPATALTDNDKTMRPRNNGLALFKPATSAWKPTDLHSDKSHYCHRFLLTAATDNCSYHQRHC